jgi:hypothetical protein
MPPTDVSAPFARPLNAKWEYHIEDLRDSRRAELEHTLAIAKEELGQAADSNITQLEADLGSETYIENRLAALGEQGWELVSASFVSGAQVPSWKMIFKRAKFFSAPSA